jgi:ethanolamine ammonia-lyase small subunit
MVRWAMRQALEADAAMLQEVRSMLASAQGVIIVQSVRADRDAYVAGRDITINRPGE